MAKAENWVSGHLVSIPSFATTSYDCGANHFSMPKISLQNLRGDKKISEDSGKKKKRNINNINFVKITIYVTVLIQ